MNEKKFDKMLKSALKENGDELIEVKEEWNEPHEFSPMFEEKMNNLIRQRKKPAFRVSRRFLQPAAAVACVFAVLFFSPNALFTTDANVSTIANIVVLSYDDHSDLTAVDVENAPQTIKDIYEITYDLSDYTLDYNYDDDRIHDISYTKGDSWIDFSQYTKNFVRNLHINTEDAVITTTTINDNEAIFFMDRNGNYWHIWDNGDYIFILYAKTNKEIAIKIAESVQKVE